MIQRFFKIALLLPVFFQLTLQNGGHGQIPGVALSIVFIFGGLVMGSFLKMFSRISHFPYNPLLVLAGLILGYYHPHLSFLGKAAVLVSELNPNGVIAIFLPALIFESAFKTQWHMFKKQLGQTLILGIPCAISGSLIIMVCLKFFAQIYSVYYSWTEALLVGSILTCTDIFSFIHRLRKKGTPQKITSLIEGESLINYCTCVLIFQVINEIVVIDSQDDSLLLLVQLFVQETLGGIVFGLIVAIIALQCLKRIIYDGILVVTIMVIFNYSVYLIAEFSLIRVSGIISLVAYALYMNVFGKTIITGEVNKYVNTFWTYIVFVAETSIFLIAGVNIGVKAISSQKLDFSDELSISVYVYIVCVFARIISISTFMKWLSTLGYGLNMKEALIIAYTGLKGAIGISLALLVYQNQAYNQNMRHLTLFITAGNSILSLVINGGTASMLVKFLGISTLTKTQYKFYKQFLFTFESNILQKKNELKDAKCLEGVNWQEIDVLIGIPNYKKIRDQTDCILQKSQMSDGVKFGKRQMYKLEQMLKNYTKRNQAVQNTVQLQASSQAVRFDLVVELRKRFIKATISKYWEYHDESYISPGALLLLLQSAYFDLDTQTEELQSWSWIKSQISYNIKFLSELMKISLLNRMAKSYLFKYISYCYDIVSSYVEASQSIRSEFRQFTLINHQKQILETIMTESQQNQKEAEAFLKNYLQPSFPEIERQVVTRKASYHVISYFKNITYRFYETGQLEPNEYDLLKNIIQQRSLQLDLSSPKWQKTQFIELLKKDTVFNILPVPVLEMLSKQLSLEETFDVNEKIIQNAQIAKNIYFIKKGGCEVQFINENSIYKESYVKGQIIGFQAIVSNIFRSTATANTMMSVASIKKSCIQKLMDAFPEFEEMFWKRHLFQLYKMFLSRNDLTFHLSHLKRKTIDELLEKFQIQQFQAGSIIEANQDMIFLRGQIKMAQQEFQQADQIHPMMFISKKDEIKLQIKTKSTFLIGQVDYDLIERSNKFYNSYRVGSKIKKKENSSQHKEQ